MDDAAASQQLIDEGARAERAGGGDSILEDEQEVLSLPSTPAVDPMLSQQTLPSSMPSAALKLSRDTKKALRNEPASPPIANTSASLTPRRIEVPDSQLAPATSRPNHSPSAIAAQSSFAIPASVQEASTSKKGKKRLRAEVDADSIAPEQHTSNDQEDAGIGAAETTPALAPQKKRRRSRKTYATPSSTETGSEQAFATSEKETVTSLSAPDVVEGVASSKKRTNLARKITGKKPLSDPVEDDDIAAGDEPIVGRKSLIKRFKKTKPSGTPKQLATQESDPEPFDEAHKMGNLDVDQTPVEIRSAEAERPDAAESPLQTKKRRSTKKKPDDGVPIAQPGPDATQNDIDPVEDEVSNASPSKDTPKQKRKLKPKRTPSSTPQRSYARKSHVDTSKAERELNTFRDLRFDTELPTSGDFTEDENELLRRAVRDYHQRKGLDLDSLVSIIQWADPSCDPVNARWRKDWTEQDFEYEEESKEFWDDITNTQPSLQRTREIIKRHVQGQFSTYKCGAWTEDEDKQLKKLVEAYPRKWKIISLSMGNRSAHDCLNRWKDYVQFGDSRNNGKWTVKEEASLLNALRTFIQKDEEQRDAAKLPSLAEYSTGDIRWAEIVKLMGYVRNRPQCTAKWTAMKDKGDASANIRPNYRRGRTPDPTRIAEPTPKKSKVQPTPKKRKAEPTPKKTKASRTSNAHAGSENDQEAGGSTKRRRKSRKSETGVDDTKKRRQSKRSEEVAADTAHAEGIEEEIPETPRQERNAATPVSKHARSVLQTPKTPTLDVAQMRWGDKFDLLEAIAMDINTVNEEDVDWHQISRSMKNNWSVRVLQAAVKELLTLVAEQENFMATVLEVLEYLVENIDHKELKEHYDPFDVDFLGEEDDTRVKVSESAKKSMLFANGSDPGENEEEL
jgi:hypothetical protein